MLLGILCFGLLLFVCVGLYKANQLTRIQIVKTIRIKGSQTEVFDMVRYLNNFPKWSPFLAQDPDQKYEVKGTDGAVGARYHWDGNKGKDLGFMEIVRIDAPNYVGMVCDIQKPFVAKPTFEYYFRQQGDYIEVKQDFQLQSGLGDAFFMWLFNARAEMEKTNQQGLDLLKNAVEKTNPVN